MDESENRAETLGGKTPAAASLSTALRRARLEEAERSAVFAELRGAEIARLEMMEEAIKPVLAQAPESVDLFDLGLSLGERPKLFVDMLAYIEMGRDRRMYSLVQSTRHGRVTIAQSERIEPIVEAVTQYVARRLVEREKALASTPVAMDEARPAGASTASENVVSVAPQRGAFATAVAALVQLLGIVTLLVLLAGGVAFLVDAAPRFLAAHPLR